MRDLSTARFRVFWAQTPQDRAQAQALRHLAFRGAPGLDCDRFDAAARHLIVQSNDGAPLATFRVTGFEGADDLSASYCAQFYDLTAFAAQPGRKAEIGRLCLHPDAHDADLVRLCWAALAGFVLGQGVDHLFGCSSFSGADPERHAPALAWLHQNALGPADLRPKARPAGAIALKGQRPDLAGMPGLLRFYVTLGAWVADRAIQDADLNTLHVFTALSIARLSPSQNRLFHALANPPAAPAPVDAATKAV